MMAAQLIITCASNRVSLLPPEPPTQAYVDLSSDLPDNSTAVPIASQRPFEDTQTLFSQLDPQQWLMPELFPWDQWSSLFEEPVV